MAFDLGWRFSSKDRGGQDINGVVFAPSKDDALAKLRRGGLEKPSHVGFDFEASLNGLTSSKIGYHDLAQFYDAMGKSVRNNRSPKDGVQQAFAFIFDLRLREAMLLMLQSLLDGSRVSRAMRSGGFPERDCAAIMAAEDSGKMGDAFVSMAKEVARTNLILEQTKTLFMFPTIVVAGLYAGAVFATTVAGPKIQTLLKTLNMEPEGGQKLLLDGYNFYSQNPLIYYGIAAGIPAAIVWFVYSPYFKQLLDKWGTWHAISERGDIASTWTNFAMLLDAGVPPSVAAKTSRGSARREDTREAFMLMERGLASGKTIGKAAAMSGFPDYLVQRIKAAESSGSSIVDEVFDLAQSLEEIVMRLVSKLKKQVELYSSIMVGAAIMGAYATFIIPIMKIGFKAV